MEPVDAIEILLVEDDQGDIDLMRELLQERKFLINMNVVQDGEQALAYLRRQGAYAKATRPDTILLDLNLPRMDGRQVLEQIKKDPDLRMIPVVVLTSSDADEDVLRSYGVGANCYVTKPVGMEGMEKVVRTIKDFWLTIVKLPSSKQPAE